MRFDNKTIELHKIPKGYEEIMEQVIDSYPFQTTSNVKRRRKRVHSRKHSSEYYRPVNKKKRVDQYNAEYKEKHRQSLNEKRCEYYRQNNPKTVDIILKYSYIIII